MIHTLSIQLLDREEALALRALIEELGYTVELHRSEGARVEPKLPAREWRTGKLTLSHLAANPSRTFTQEDLSIMLEENGYKPGTASPLLWQLVRDGDIHKLSAGLYRHKEK